MKIFCNLEYLVKVFEISSMHSYIVLVEDLWIDMQKSNSYALCKKEWHFLIDYRIKEKGLDP